MKFTVHLDKPKFVMRGGVGASWHAIEEGLRHGAGSAWGGNPAHDDEAGWKKLYYFADHLGMSFVRVEMEQKMYQPTREKFTFDSSPMKSMYRILDWCEKRGADVFLQQMYQNVDWNVYPGVDACHSAPLDLAAFADGMAALVEHLLKVKKYTCIKWLCITNEPLDGFSWWQGYDNQPLKLTPGLRAVRKSLDRLGISLPLAGPDCTGLKREVSMVDFDDLVGAYDLHTYLDDFRMQPPGMSAGESILNGWVQYANKKGKPFFLTEFGAMQYGWYTNHPGPGTFPATLRNAEIILRGLYAGVEGFSRWSYVNRGDLDGQFQLVDTWDVANDRLMSDFSAHCPAYLGYSLFTRFLKKGSTVLQHEIDSLVAGWQQYHLAATIRDPDGHLSLFVLCYTVQGATLQIDLQGLDRARKFHKYQFNETHANLTGPQALAAMSPTTSLELAPGRVTEDTVPGLSITVYSTRLLRGDEPAYSG